MARQARHPISSRTGPDHPDRFAYPQRNRDDVAEAQLELGGRPIGIRMVERDRHQNVDDAYHAECASLRKAERSHGIIRVVSSDPQGRPGQAREASPSRDP